MVSSVAAKVKLATYRLSSVVAVADALVCRLSGRLLVDHIFGCQRQCNAGAAQARRQPQWRFALGSAETGADRSSAELDGSAVRRAAPLGWPDSILVLCGVCVCVCVHVAGFFLLLYFFYTTLWTVLMTVAMGLLMTEKTKQRLGSILRVCHGDDDSDNDKDDDNCSRLQLSIEVPAGPLESRVRFLCRSQHPAHLCGHRGSMRVDKQGCADGGASRAGRISRP